MLKIKALIAEHLCEGIRTLTEDCPLTVAEVAAMLEYPPDPAMGDLALPCFKLSKQLRRSPVQIAAAVAPAIKG